MSWMRSPIYAWGDGRSVHLWVREDTEGFGVMDPEHYLGFAGGIHMREAEFDALVLLRMAQLIRDTKAMRKALKRAKKHRGNFGTWDLMEMLGEDPEGEFRRRMAKIKAERDSSP
jgi:hypothetical protein